VHPAPMPESPVLYVASYTLFHYIAFACVGTVAAATAAWASEEPAILLGFVMLFAAFEVGFYGFVALLQHVSPLGALAWYQVMTGNIIATIAMGAYLWRIHPRLHDQRSANGEWRSATSDGRPRRAMMVGRRRFGSPF